MPTVKDNIVVEIDFEVVCDDCGTGLCSHTKVRGTSVYVPTCPKCMAQKDYEIDELTKQIAELEKKVNQLENI